MDLLKIVSVVCLCIAHVYAVGYGGAPAAATFRPVSGHGAGIAGVGAGRGGSSYNTGAYNPGQVYPPQPYNFDYQARDEQGNVHYRQEQGDGGGAVRGSYGYTDAQGLYRVVEYVADANGFRANVRTNEPGVGKDSPADVVLAAVDPPAGIQDRYTRVGGAGYRTPAASYASGVVAGSGFGAAPAGFGSGFHGSKGAY